MSDFKSYQVSEFNLEGQFLGFVGEAIGKRKYLRVTISTGELQIKVPKEFRTPLAAVLLPGDWIQIRGKKKLNQQTGELKLKAEQVRGKDTVHCSCTPDANAIAASLEVLPSQPKAKILLCQKSGCRKRGGKRLYQALEAALRDRNLQHRVIIEHTGCLKRCSKAPNMLLMPGKTHLSGIKPEAIASLLEKLLTNFST